MLITPLPGVHQKSLCQSLTNLQQAVVNIRGGATHPAMHRVFTYLDWVNEVRRQLRTQISAASLNTLVPPDRYQLLISTAASLYGKPQGAEMVLNGLLAVELDERIRAFKDALAGLDAQVKQFEVAGRLVVLDSNVYLHHPQKLEEVDLAPALGTRHNPIHILVPMVVVDELDALKQHSKAHNRWRAGYTTAVLDSHVYMPDGFGVLRPEDFSRLVSDGVAHGRVTIQIMFDPPGHVRLPINDDEIIDRALSVEPLAGRQVTMVTYDTGMAMRAKAAGLEVVKLEQDLGEEPKVA
ncbi:PIN domain-containing protein [Micromonospora sp. GCM10011542]|uniref:PIN domain-containing protein n=1 Tax=Micromonospora sp. GCM10011542 TaxID=3317337 RepID=UPI0036104787